jgi:predicted Zn-dependent peptidase
MKGFSAKSANRSDENIEDQNFDNLPNDENKLSDEIEKLNKLLNDGVLTQEEFEKAKKKLLDN